MRTNHVTTLTAALSALDLPVKLSRRVGDLGGLASATPPMNRCDLLKNKQSTEPVQSYSTIVLHKNMVDKDTHYLVKVLIFHFCLSKQIIYYSMNRIG